MHRHQLRHFLAVLGIADNEVMERARGVMRHRHRTAIPAEVQPSRLQHLDEQRTNVARPHDDQGTATRLLQSRAKALSIAPDGTRVSIACACS